MPNKSVFTSSSQVPHMSHNYFFYNKRLLSLIDFWLKKASCTQCEAF